MSIVVSSASALGTPISWHIEIAGPDVCATLSGGVLVNDVVLRIPRSVERLAEDRRLPHMSGRTQPTARGGDLLGVPAVLVVAVLWSFRGAAAVCTAVHSTPPPPGDRRRLTWCPRPGTGPTLTGSAKPEEKIARFRSELILLPRAEQIAKYLWLFGSFERSSELWTSTFNEPPDVF
jgi:hypothetical protein